MAYNSTIVSKKKPCVRCGKLDFWFSHKMCKTCATIESSLKRQAEETEREIKEQGLSELVDILDEVFARWVKLSSADENGWVTCFVTGQMFKVNAIDAGHFIPRGCMYLRWDPRNVKPQSKISNQAKDGDGAKFALALERERPGIVEILQEEGHIVHSWSRREINEMIREYRIKNRDLEAKIIVNG